VVLVTDAGQEVLRAGDAAGFKASDPDGHHLQNRSAAPATVLEIGSRHAGEVAYYSDIGMMTPGERRARPLHPPRRHALTACCGMADFSVLRF
jgi:uncharacterized cupin superfamily protein